MRFGHHHHHDHDHDHHHGHHHHRMSPVRFVLTAVMFLVVGTLAAFVFGYVAMSLWNWLMPEIFGLKVISFWQAFGLLVLSWLFFGRFRGGHHWHGRHWRHRMFRRWERMSPEEREKFREKMHRHWGEPPSEGNAG